MNLEQGASPPKSVVMPPLKDAPDLMDDRRAISVRLKRKKEQIVGHWLANQFAPDLVRRFHITGISERVELNQSFVSSLFDLLLVAILEDDSGCREVYLDERLRYAPHQQAPSVVVDFFTEILDRDEAVLLDVLDQEQRETATLILSRLHAPLRTHPDPKAIRLLAVGDCLLNELRVFLPERMRQSGFALDMRCLYFSAVMGRALSTTQVVEFIQNMSPQLISFSFLTYAGIPPYTALVREADSLSTEEIADRVTGIMAIIREFLTTIRENTDATFLIHNSSGLPLTGLRRRLPLPALSRGRRRLIQIMNNALSEYCENAVNTLLIDEHAVALSHGYRESSRAVVPRSVTKDGFFHTSRFGDFLTAPYEEVIRSYALLHKAKVLLVDFDNTLWDGVMADGPVHHHIERQTLLRTLKDAGMLLVSVSKNTFENVRWEEMQLSPADFALHKINWDLKVNSITSAAQELDLGLDSFVLIDDNPAERELVRRELPTVRLLDANEQSSWESLKRLLMFPNTQSTEEAKTRTEMYRAQAERREIQSKALDYPAMMRSLQLKAAIGLAGTQDLDRLVELVQRTNQFNTTTIRYTRVELKQMMDSNEHAIYVADLADKFGKYGLVAVAVVTKAHEETEVLAFVMSCRAMGFGLEQLLLGVLMDEVSSGRPVTGRFIPTDRNTPSAGMFRDAGFQETEAGVWRIDNPSLRTPVPDWIEMVAR